MTRREALDTEAMLHRLTNVLYGNKKCDNDGLQCRTDAESLRRISMTLHRWHELECNGEMERGTVSGRPYYCYTDHNGHRRQSDRPIPDREAGALARLAKIMARYPSLSSYVQTDPRGCALYILRPGDVPAGQDVSAYYSRGVAVHQ